MDRLSFIVVPYLQVQGSFIFADYQFVSLQELNAYADGSVLEAAKVIAGQYRDQINNLITSMTFVFPKGNKLGDYLDDNVKTEIADMLKVLYLDGFCHMDQLHVVTAENFEAVFYDMQLDNYMLSVVSGGVFPQTMAGGDMKNISYTTPPYVIINRGDFTLSPTMSPTLAHIVEQRTPILLTSLSFFFGAMRNDDRRTLINRTTDLYLAFLQLMKSPTEGGERKLWWKTMLKISEAGLPTYSYPIIDTNTGQPTKDSPQQLNIVQIWGEEFYKLRCKIVHGDKLTVSDFAFSDISGNNLVSNRPGHFYLGANVFPVLLFYKFQQEYPSFPDAPSLVIDVKKGLMNQNYTYLGFGKVNYTLPFYVNDMSLRKALLKALNPLV